MAAVGASVVGSPTAALAEPHGAPTAVSAPQTVQRITIPMVAVAHTDKRFAGPLTRVTGNCGVAFLYLARVNGDETRATYGFDHLLNAAVAYTAHAAFFNEDTDDIAQDSAHGGLLLRRSFERSVTKYANYGEVTVHAHVKAYGTVYDCESTSALHDSIYVY